ncbi:hypothetical protein CGI22_24315 [Vibrio parahaemolyticus]|uniref:hypothetical protein n=1 Tax=Vibrio parahaemolyticus TaxID=670 RepID=UPI001124C962|nr:hypothetical protein [Vibrio parahaemolyticus]TOK18428.1 hypothetical protein CGI22_24315 [Vibrio parahaemolyticus]
MKKSHYEILKYIYDHDDAGIREICSLMTRKHNDHRDFYGLVALLEAEYVRFTGPIQQTESGSICSYSQACVFQAYSQGEGTQSYGNVSLLPTEADQFLYIGPKAIEYFHAKSEARTGWLLTGLLSLLTAIISGVVVSNLTITAIEVVGRG